MTEEHIVLPSKQQVVLIQQGSCSDRLAAHLSAEHFTNVSTKDRKIIQEAPGCHVQKMTSRAKSGFRRERENYYFAVLQTTTAEADKIYNSCKWTGPLNSNYIAQSQMDFLMEMVT